MRTRAVPPPDGAARPGATSPARRTDVLGLALATAVGAAGGACAGAVVPAALDRLIAAGALLGLVGGAALRGRATNPGAGLIWGLGGGFMLWMVLPALAVLFRFAGYSAEGMLGESRARFPELVGCLVGIGAPVGIFLGFWGHWRRAASASYHWGRALVAGAAAGVGAALIFSRWMYEGNFYPLISGFGALGTHVETVLFHFAVACLIGSTFGLLFQLEVRNLGSAMGWGVAYALFWWFFGQLTILPLAAGRTVDWSSAHASDFFGPMVGHILFGLILGVVYAGVNAIWTRLFVDADPLNRKREGPGVRLLHSLAWGSAAGLGGGLISLPLMIQTGVIAKLAGLDAGLPTGRGVILHLLVSTVIGASYGVLFRGETANVISGSLWGFVIGLIWWYAGPLTLLPLFRTGECDWRPAAAAALLPSLGAHLVFGGVTANLFLAFERHYTRWLFSDPRAAALEQSRPRADATPAPALWVFVLGVGVLLPIVLA